MLQIRISFYNPWIELQVSNSYSHQQSWFNSQTKLLWRQKIGRIQAEDMYQDQPLTGSTFLLVSMIVSLWRFIGLIWIIFQCIFWMLIPILMLQSVRIWVWRIVSGYYISKLACSTMPIGTWAGVAPHYNLTTAWQSLCKGQKSQQNQRCRRLVSQSAQSDLKASGLNP